MDSLTHLEINPRKPKLGKTEDVSLVVADDIAFEVANSLPNFSIHQLGISEERSS